MVEVCMVEGMCSANLKQDALSSRTVCCASIVRCWVERHDLAQRCWVGM